MQARTKTAAVTVVALALLAVHPVRRVEAEAVPCGTFQPPDCGGSAGDAACGDSMRCVDVEGSCQCEAPACCRCDSLGGSSACDMPCADEFIDLLTCPQECFKAEMSGATCDLTVVLNGACAAGNCKPTGCCQFTLDDPPPGVTSLCAETTEATCAVPGGTFVPGGSCAGGITGQCTVAMLQDGSPCMSGRECQSTFCADGVCCNSACGGPFQTCNAPGLGGTCTSPAPAPTLSPFGLLLGLCALVLAGAVALLWRMPRHSTH